MPINYGQHTNRIKVQYRATVRDLEPGMIAIINYRPKDKNSPQGTRLILVLNEKWPRADPEWKIHAINLEDSYYNDLIKAVDELGLEPSKFQVNKKPLIEKYNSDVQKPRQFYSTKVRSGRIDKYRWKGKYRTYIHKNIISVRIVDYDWPEKILKKFGLYEEK